MTQRHPIMSHPAFVPLIVLWFGALLGLTLAVLPAPVVERGLAAVGLSGLVPLTLAGRIAASAAAATIGALGGYALARPFARRWGGDPRPIYAEAEPAFEYVVGDPPVRRPLRVREELADGFGDESQVLPADAKLPGAPASAPSVGAAQTQGQPQPQEDFMILTPQPIHPPHPAPDLEALLDQFDSVFAAFRAGEGERAEAASQRPSGDPVQTFVAQQTGVPAPSAAHSPMGGLVPDHQAELRAALDKLARSQRKG
jgi:hypothetical protein